MGRTQEEQVGPLGALFNVERSEWGRVLLSGGFFFCVLFGVMMLRPVREAMGVESGMWRLRELFYWTAGVSLVVAIAFGGLVSRLNRRVFIPVGFQVVALCLVLFMVGRLVMGDAIRVHTGEVFYVWYSVFNMFVVSVFWSFMADIWRLEQAKRLYPVIGVGGTLGAIAGTALPGALTALGTLGMIAGMALPGVLSPLWPIWIFEHLAVVLMGCAVAAFEIAVCLMLLLDRMAVRETQTRAPSRLIGGTLVDGVVAVARSPYLLGISLYIVLIAVSSTVLYFAGAEMVVDKEDELEGRLLLFAWLDFWKQVATLFFQLFVTSRLIRAIGVGGTLCVLPVLTLIGFAAVWVAGRGSDAWVWGTFTLFQALHSASRYAFVRPARETLFSVLGASEKYKAKSVIDLSMYRGGDVVGVSWDTYLKGMGLATIGSMAAFAAPISVIWMGLAISLGVMQKRRADTSVEDEAPGVGGGGVHSQGV